MYSTLTTVRHNSLWSITKNPNWGSLNYSISPWDKTNVNVHCPYGIVMPSRASSSNSSEVSIHNTWRTIDLINLHLRWIKNHYGDVMISNAKFRGFHILLLCFGLLEIVNQTINFPTIRGNHKMCRPHEQSLLMLAHTLNIISMSET